MDQSAVIRAITGTFDGVEELVGAGDSYFYVNLNPGEGPTDYRMPFATLMTSDAYDRASDLSRPSVYRLNIGVSPETYRSLFGAKPPRSDPEGDKESGHDFTALDQVMPHPVYAPQFWLCVLNPSEETFQSVRPLLAEAYERAVARYNRTERGEPA